MPVGAIKWYDASAGEGVVLHGRREVPFRVADVERAARVAGARVHFDVEREAGGERAVRIRLRRGTRVSPSQHRFGDLAGAHHSDEAGRSPLTHHHPDRDPDVGMEGHPVRVARAWAEALREGQLERALHLYSPDAVLDDGRVTRTGRASVESFLEVLDLLTPRALDPTIHPGPDSILIRWPPESGRLGVETRAHIAHGRIHAMVSKVVA